MSTTTAKADVYSRVTDRIIEQLEQGVRPWAKPWNGSNADGFTRPLRFNGEPYKGINTLMLWEAAEDAGFASPTWLTFNQAKASGGCVRRGEHGSLVVYASKANGQPDEDTGESKEYFFMRGYTVFNVEQVDGLPEKFYAKPIEAIAESTRIEQADAFFKTIAADVRHGGDAACYVPAVDFIRMPPFVTFRDAVSYYGTLAHEHIHWTSHATRLDRNLNTDKRTHSYAREELVAEIGAAFIACDLGIAAEPREDHASYVAHWLKVLKEDKRAIFQAASAAQKAADYLNGLAKV